MKFLFLHHNKRVKEICCPKPKKKAKKIAIITLIVIIVNSLIVFIWTNVNRTVYDYIDGRVRALSIKAVNNAVSELVTNKNIYDNLINISTDNDGKIVLIQANSIQINMLTKDLIKTSQIKLEKIGIEGVNIPIGTFSGITLLNGKGPSVNVRLIPVGDVSCSFVSKFEEAGINQTLHKLYVNIDTNVNIILPLKNNVVKTTTSILICESVIVGQVPTVYLNTNKLDNLMNLIP